MSNGEQQENNQEDTNDGGIWVDCRYSSEESISDSAERILICCFRGICCRTRYCCRQWY